MNPLDEDTLQFSMCGIIERICYVSSNRNGNNFLIYPIYRGTIWNNDPCAESTETNQTKKNYFLDGLHFGHKRHVSVMFCQIGWQSMNQFHHFRKVIELSDP